MGEAGWVPLDTTASETNYVDSGHIRIGIVQSLTTSLNAQPVRGARTPHLSRPAAPLLPRQPPHGSTHTLESSRTPSAASW